MQQLNRARGQAKAKDSATPSHAVCSKPTAVSSFGPTGRNSALQSLLSGFCCRLPVQTIHGGDYRLIISLRTYA